MELPKNKDLTYLGLASFRDRNQLFGIKRKDRRQHVYVLGKSGTGKSVLLSNMIVQNMQNGDGVCVVDPHGELVEGILQSIPPERMRDVVYFNPADTDFHMGFNVLELLDPKYKHLVASGLMGIFTKIWANAWSARMEYILNNAILALLDTPGSTLLGIPRMLVDKEYRRFIIGNLKDPVIKAFWVHEYEAWQDKFRNEAIAPIQNKVGQFLSSAIIRNVVGQAKSTINVFDIMNQGKIFLVNVSKGRIGEDNSALLGGMIITKVQLAAMERVRIEEERRKDFYLYVDEFQNFVTDSFASILSEARKYRLNLTVAHQYTAQLVTSDSSSVRDAIFGNVGTMIIFRVGADDAEFLEKEFEPEFMATDIVNLPNYKVYMKLMIDGVTSRPFSAKTLPPIIKNPDPKIEEEVIKTSRALYCRPREVIEREINEWSGMFASPEAEVVEKFKAQCSICKKEAMVPFKPESGRPIYCKDCIAKIKAGEIKPLPSAPRPAEKAEKPAAPMPPLPPVPPGPKNPTTPAHAVAPMPEVRKAPTVAPMVFTTNAPARNIFKPPAQKERPKDNSALRHILNKTLTENKVLEEAPVKTPTVEPISLSSLKKASPASTIRPPLADRAASADDMNKLKDIISGVAPSAPRREVPEDVLRSLLD